ncbi:hypothetical protein D918_09331 [Trichuris suis]|nr:hypothetical protein D918_09331 [Trichuris suis]
MDPVVASSQLPEHPRLLTVIVTGLFCLLIRKPASEDNSCCIVLDYPSYCSFKFLKFCLSEEIKCGSIIRLGHLNTKCLLHSHLFKSPLSGSQEVSCFGKNLIGDTGDNWMVVCDDKLWSRKGVVSFRHVDTGKYVS